MLGILSQIFGGGQQNQQPAPERQWNDVSLGSRLMAFGAGLSGDNMAPYLLNMQNQRDAAMAARKQKKDLEIAEKYLAKRPDLRPLVEAGVISLGDIVKMDMDSSSAKAKAAAEREDWLFKERFKMENDPDRQWWEQFNGGATPASTAAPGVRTATASPAPGPTPAPDGAANVPGVPAAIDPITQKMRDVLGDPTISPQEARFIQQTVRNPDDLRSAYDTILKNRTESAKVKIEQDKLADEKAEIAKKEAGQKAAGEAAIMTATSAIDQTLSAMDQEGLPASGTLGALFSNVPGTNAYKAKVNLDALRSYVSLDKLQNMRANSSTGASGLGQVTNYEQRMLGSAQGAIDQGLDDETLRNNLITIRSRIVAFNTPSAEDPSKSQLTVDSEKLAANPTPDVVEAFEAKYGIGSSSAITGDTTPAGERPQEEEDPAAPPPPEGMDPTTWKFMTPEQRALWQN